ESNTRVVNDGFNTAWDQWIIRIPEFHGSRNAEATLVRSTCNPLLRQVDRVLDGLWRSHREGIATASLYRHIHAMVTHQIRQPCAGSYNNLVCFFAAAVGVHYGCLSATFDRFHGLAGYNFAAAISDSLGDGFDVWTWLDKALAFQSVHSRDFIREDRNHG